VVDYEAIHARGDRASYSLETDLIQLTDRPAEWQAEQRQGRADELVLDRRNGLFRSRGHAWLKMPSGSGTHASSFLPEPRAAAGSAPVTNQFVQILADNYEFGPTPPSFVRTCGSASFAASNCKGK